MPPFALADLADKTISPGRRTGLGAARVVARYAGLGTCCLAVMVAAAIAGCSLSGGSVVSGSDAATSGAGSPPRRGSSDEDGGAGIGDAAGVSDRSAGAADASDGAVAPPACPGCRVTVRYTCSDTGPVQAQRGFWLRLVNPTSQLIPLAGVTVRYWFTAAELARQVFECDFASVHSLQGTCADIVPASSFNAVTPPRPNANAYFEVGFTARAGALEALHDDATDRIQIRLHDLTFTAADQRADYSYNCGMPGREIESTRITAYINGALVFGREPQ